LSQLARNTVTTDDLRRDHDVADLPARLKSADRSELHDASCPEPHGKVREGRGHRSAEGDDEPEAASVDLDVRDALVHLARVGPQRPEPFLVRGGAQ
jgi:hypothetical protein